MSCLAGHSLFLCSLLVTGVIAASGHTYRILSISYVIYSLLYVLCSAFHLLTYLLIYLLVTLLSNISTALSTSLSTDHFTQLLTCLPLYLLVYLLLYLLIYLLTSLLSTLFIHLFTHQSFNLSRHLVISSPNTLFTEHFIYTFIYILASKHSLKHALSVWQKSNVQQVKKHKNKVNYTHQLIFRKPTQ